MNVICFVDSNTYGYDPRGYFGGRYEADFRWVDISLDYEGVHFTEQGHKKFDAGLL